MAAMAEAAEADEEVVHEEADRKQRDQATEEEAAHLRAPQHECT